MGPGEQVNDQEFYFSTVADLFSSRSTVAHSTVAVERPLRHLPHGP
jgi:hypothetical protein